MVEDLRGRLCNDGHEDQFPLFRLSARDWSSDETFVEVHKSDDVGRDALKPAVWVLLPGAASQQPTSRDEVAR
jgi:hypothetical protein